LTRLVAADGFEIAAEFVEVETGKGSNALDRRANLSPTQVKTCLTGSEVYAALADPRWAFA
jgi:hypothetical protein